MAKRRGRNSRGVGNKEKDDKEKDEEKEKEKETDWTPKLAVVALFFTLWWTNIAIENGHL